MENKINEKIRKAYIQILKIQKKYIEKAPSDLGYIQIDFAEQLRYSGIFNKIKLDGEDYYQITYERKYNEIKKQTIIAKSERYVEWHEQYASKKQEFEFRGLHPTINDIIHSIETKTVQIIDFKRNILEVENYVREYKYLLYK